MGKNKQSTTFTKDCTPNCKSKLHTSELIAAITSKTEDISDLELASYICGKCYCFSKNRNENGQTLLHVAASTGRRDLCKYLIEHNKDSIFEQEYTSGYTPLHCSLYFGFINVAVLLIQNESDLSLLDKDRLTAIDHVVLTPLSTAKINRFNYHHINDVETEIRLRESKKPPVYEGPVDVSVWGNNTNYTIGLSSGQKSEEPKILEIFRNERILEVYMQTYHTLFLDDKGKVWSCGLGTGGRLGQNSEEVTVLPQKINMDDPKIVFTKIAAGDHHSVFLTDKGKVYTCGLNKYHQLGIERNMCNVYPAYVSIPTPVKPFNHEEDEICGVCASNYHSAAWTVNNMYTCGLNIGQLGPVDGNESRYFQRTFQNKFPGSIHHVVTSDTTTVLTTTHDDIIIINNGIVRCINNLALLDDCRYLAKSEETFFTIPPHRSYLRAKAICGPFLPNIIQVQVIGGHQKIMQIPDHTMFDMLIVILQNNGNVYVYKENYNRAHRCLLLSSYNIFITSISVNFNNAFLTSKEGEVYKATFGDLVKWYRTTPQKDDGFEIVGSNNTWQIDERCLVEIVKIPFVYRALSVYSDRRGSNFCLIQKRSNGKIKSKPRIKSCSLVEDIRNLLLSATENDEVHDVVYEVGGRKFAAHKFIVASTCHELAILPVSTDGYVHVNSTHPTIFEQLLLYIYTGSCDLLNIGECSIRIPAENVNRKKCTAFQNPIKLFGGLAKSFNIKPLISLVGNLRYNLKEHRIEAIRIELYYGIPEVPKLNRKSFQLLYDICLKSPDGSILMAHKCVLIARLEYFRSMFSGCWRESKMGNKELKLNFPYNILRHVINFLYTDVLTPNDSELKDLSFWIGLFAASSELLVPKLFELCEITLAECIDVRNIGNMMELAYMHSAQQLLEATFEFAYINIPSILLSRTLERINENVLDRFSKYYRQKVTTEHPVMPKILPYESCPSIQQMKEIAEQYPISWDDEPGVFVKVEEVKEKKKKKKKRGKRTPVKILEETDQQVPCQNNDSIDSSNNIIDCNWKEVKTKTLKTGLKIATAIRDNPELLNEAEDYTPFSLKKNESSYEGENSSKKLSPILLNIDYKNITPKISQGQRKRLKSFKKNEKKTEESDEEGGKECCKPAWNIEPNNNDLSACLADIIDSEKKQKKRESPVQPSVFVPEDLLALTQIEEKAIQQLTIFYNVGKVDDEVITVERVSGGRIYNAPTWIRHSP